MTPFSKSLVLAALVSGAAACSSNASPGPVLPQTDGGGAADTGNVPTDGGGGTDTGTVTTDTGTASDGGTQTDGSRTGADGGDGGDAMVTPPVDAGPPYDPCVASAVIDLSTAGMRTGSTTRYMGTNAAVGGMSPLTASCTANTGHEVVLRYTPATSARLRVSTANTGTSTTLDTVVFALNRCAATGSTELGCNDDGHDMTLTRASTFTTTSAVTMGTPIFIVVAGFTPATDTMWTETGPFVLTVTELTQVAVGAACDSTGATNYCATGSTCVGTGAAAHCLADGALGGACRTAMGTTTECDTGLACDGTSCVMPVAVGGVCTDASVCATGSSCRGTTTMHCVADGSVGAPCRTAAGMPACDMGLACSVNHSGGESLCRTAVATGAACDPMGVTNACTAPGLCVTAGTASTCVLPPYTETALPSATFIDACTGGTRVMLAASTSTDPRDDNFSAAAIAVPFTFQFFGAPVTQAWPDTNGFVQFGAAGPTTLATGGVGAFPSTDVAAVIAPFWQDLILPASPGADICVRTVGTAPSRQFVIEWLGATAYMHPMVSLTFEAVLNETTNTVDLIYSHLSAPAADADYASGARASVGMQNAAGTVYVTHGGTVSTTAGIRFAPR